MDILTKINVDGVDYDIAPVASENQLGLIKIGTGLAMSEDGSVYPNLGSGFSFGEDKELVLKLGTGLVINTGFGNKGELILDIGFLKSFIDNYLNLDGGDETTTTSTSTTTTTRTPPPPIVDDTTTTTTTTTTSAPN